MVCVRNRGDVLESGSGMRPYAESGAEDEEGEHMHVAPGQTGSVPVDPGPYERRSAGFEAAGSTFLAHGLAGHVSPSRRRVRRTRRTLVHKDDKQRPWPKTPPLSGPQGGRAASGRPPVAVKSTWPGRRACASGQALWRW